LGEHKTHNFHQWPLSINTTNTRSGSLGCPLDEFTVLIKLAAHGHVAELVTNAHHHATNDGRINLVRNQSLLSCLQESSQGGFDLLKNLLTKIDLTSTSSVQHILASDQTRFSKDHIKFGYGSCF